MPVNGTRSIACTQSQTGIIPKLVFISLLMVGLLSSCVPEVVKYNDEGNASFEENAYSEALDAYRLAQVSEPDQPEPYYNAANTYNRQGDVAGTALQTEQALKTSDTGLQAQALYNLGNAFFDSQEWQQAVEAYKQTLRLDPDDEDAKYNLELALRAAQEQQEQEKSESEDQEQDEQSGENQEGEDEQSESPEPSPGEEDASEQEEPRSDQGETKDDSEEVGMEDHQMTPEQAQQLLDALLEDSETLQEHLQHYFQAPGAAPEEDW